MRSLLHIAIILSQLSLAACVSTGDRVTLASLRNASIEIKEEKVEGSLDKAMESYQKFLKETPETAMTPEAIRRLADLKIEKEYSSYDEPISVNHETQPGVAATGMATIAPEKLDDTNNGIAVLGNDKDKSEKTEKLKSDVIANSDGESDKKFEKRATK